MASALYPISLPVAGMTCAACDSHVDDILKALQGVSGVSYSASTHRVHLSYDPTRISIKEMVGVAAEAGYLVLNPQLTLRVQGMSSTTCARHVERALQELPGVEDAVVKLASGTARVRYVAGAVTVSDMIRAVHEAGYEVVARDEGRKP